MTRKGTPNIPRDEVETVLSRCKKCGSTARERYNRQTEIAISHGPHGEPATHIVWRNTKCLACGQHRVDKAVENRVTIAEPQTIYEPKYIAGVETPQEPQPQNSVNEIVESSDDATTFDIDGLDSDILFQ